MNAPKRWIETESGSSPLERALLRPALHFEVPAGVEQRVWATLAGVAALSVTSSAGATAAAATATAASTTAGSTGVATGFVAGAKLGAGVIVKAFAIGVASGTLFAGGLSAIESAGRPSPVAVHAPAMDSRAVASATPDHRNRPSLSVQAAPSDERDVLPTAPAAPARPVERPLPPEHSPPTAGSPAAVSAFPPVSTPAAKHAPAAEHTPAISDSTPPISQLREEARVLRRAREALRQGNLSGAFAELEVARSKFPRGALGEEREALLIELLARSGQRDAASARAASFLRRFPGSAYAANVRKFTF